MNSDIQPPQPKVKRGWCYMDTFKLSGKSRSPPPVASASPPSTGTPMWDGTQTPPYGGVSSYPAQVMDWPSKTSCSNGAYQTPSPAAQYAPSPPIHEPTKLGSEFNQMTEPVQHTSSKAGTPILGSHRDFGLPREQQQPLKQQPLQQQPLQQQPLQQNLQQPRQTIQGGGRGPLPRATTIGEDSKENNPPRKSQAEANKAAAAALRSQCNFFAQETRTSRGGNTFSDATFAAETPADVWPQVSTAATVHDLRQRLAREEQHRVELEHRERALRAKLRDGLYAEIPQVPPPKNEEVEALRKRVRELESQKLHGEREWLLQQVNTAEPDERLEALQNEIEQLKSLQTSCAAAADQAKTFNLDPLREIVQSFQSILAEQAQRPSPRVPSDGSTEVQMEALRRQLAESQHANQALELEMQKVCASLDILGDGAVTVAGEREATASSQAKLQEQLWALHGRCSELQSVLESREAALRTAEAARRQAAQTAIEYTDEASRLDSELRDCQYDLDRTRGALVEEQKQAARCTALLEDARIEEQGLAAREAQLRRETHELRSELAERDCWLDIQKAQAEMEIRQLKETSESELKKMKSEVSRASTAALAEEAAEAAAAADRDNRMAQEMKRLQEQLSETQQQLDEVEARKKQLEADLAEARTTNDQLELKLSTIEAFEEGEKDLVNSLNDAKLTIKDLEAQLEDQYEAQDSAEASWKAREAELLKTIKDLEEKASSTQKSCLTSKDELDRRKKQAERRSTGSGSGSSMSDGQEVQKRVRFEDDELAEGVAAVNKLAEAEGEEETKAKVAEEEEDEDDKKKNKKEREGDEQGDHTSSKEHQEATDDEASQEEGPQKEVQKDVKEEEELQKSEGLEVVDVQELAKSLKIAKEETSRLVAELKEKEQVTQAAEEERQQLQEEVEQLKSDIVLAREAARQRHEALETVTQQSEELQDRLQGRLAELETELETSQAQCEAQREELEETRGAVEDAWTQCRALEERLAETEEQVQGATQKASAEEQQAQKLKHELEDVKQQLEAAELRKKTLQQELLQATSGSEAKLSERSAEAEVLAEALQAERAKARKLEEAHGAATAQASWLRREAEEFRSKAKEMQAELDRARECSGAKVIELEAKLQALDVVVEERDEISKRLEETRQRLDDAQAERVRQGARAEALEEQLEGVTKKLELARVGEAEGRLAQRWRNVVSQLLILQQQVALRGSEALALKAKRQRVRAAALKFAHLMWGTLQADRAHESARADALQEKLETVSKQLELSCAGAVEGRIVEHWANLVSQYLLCRRVDALRGPETQSLKARRQRGKVVAMKFANLTWNTLQVRQRQATIQWLRATRNDDQLQMKELWDRLEAATVEAKSRAQAAEENCEQVKRELAVAEESARAKLAEQERDLRILRAEVHEKQHLSEDQRQGLEDRIKSLTEQAELYGSNKAELEQELVTLGERATSLQKQVDHYRKQVQDLESQRDALQTQAEDMTMSEQEYEKLREQSQELLKSFQHFKEENEVLVVENRSLRESLSVFEGNLDSLADRHAQLIGHSNTQQKIRYMIKLKEEASNLRAELNKARHRIVWLEERKRCEGLVETEFFQVITGSGMPAKRRSSGGGMGSPSPTIRRARSPMASLGGHHQGQGQSHHGRQSASADGSALALASGRQTPSRQRPSSTSGWSRRSSAANSQQAAAEASGGAGQRMEQAEKRCKRQARILERMSADYQLLLALVERGVPKNSDENSSGQSQSPAITDGTTTAGAAAAAAAAATAAPPAPAPGPSPASSAPASSGGDTDTVAGGAVPGMPSVPSPLPGADAGAGASGHSSSEP